MPAASALGRGWHYRYGAKTARDPTRHARRHLPEFQRAVVGEKIRTRGQLADEVTPPTGEVPRGRAG